MEQVEKPEGEYISWLAWEIVKFYEDPENIKAFKEWKERGEKHEAVN